MEVTVIAEETSAFLSHWLKGWDLLPEGMTTYMGIDPTPPQKDSTTAVNLNLDDAAIVVIGTYKGDIFLIDYYICKSPDPEEFINQIFAMWSAYHPLRVGLETVLFARTLKSYLEKEQRKRRQYFHVVPVEDKRKKRLRIVQAITGPASQGVIKVNRALHGAFIEQFERYPNVKHDDLLDAFSIALELVTPTGDADYLDGEYERLMEEERAIPELEEWRSVI